MQTAWLALVKMYPYYALTSVNSFPDTHRLNWKKVKKKNKQHTPSHQRTIPFMTEVMIMRPARVNPFCVLTFGTSGCGRLLPQRIVFMKTVNNAIKLANSLCQLSAGSLIPVQSARKPLQKKKKNCHAPGKLWWQICPTKRESALTACSTAAPN